MSATKTKIDKLTAKISDLHSKILELNRHRDELMAQLVREEALQNLNVGDVVSVKVGRGETRRIEVGKVIAVYEDDKTGKRVKVLSGIGSHTELYDVAVSQVISVEEPPKEAVA